MTITEINSGNYEKLISDKTPVIIDHFADWCGPCKMLSPIFDKISSKYKGRLNFTKLDTMAHPDIASQNNVMSIPCLIIFHKGKEIDRIIGYMNEDKLTDAINSILKKIK